jgi:hypothetical protein
VFNHPSQAADPAVPIFVSLVLVRCGPLENRKDIKQLISRYKESERGEREREVYQIKGTDNGVTRGQ